jgi:hypothetical protein
LSAILLVAGAARADDACAHPHGPPPEAYDACKEKKAGDSCQVTLHDHTIDGTCAAPPEGTGLACRPNQLPPGPPPDQASP